MALRYVNPQASSNGDGTSWGSAYNTFAGHWPVTPIIGAA